MEDRRYSKRKRLRDYNVPVEDHIEAGDYSVSPVYKLPDHLFLKIFSYLGLRDRCRIQRVCKFWQKLSTEAWKSYNILTLSREDWGCDLSYNFPMDKYLALENILQVCGPFITCLDLSRSRKSTVWAQISIYNQALLTIIGKHCPNLVVINLGDLERNSSATFLLESAKKLEELITYSVSSTSRWLMNAPHALNFKNNQCLRKIVIHDVVPARCWNQLNPQTVEEIDTTFENINEQFCIALKNWVKLKSISVSKIQRFENVDNVTPAIEAMLKSLMSVTESLKRIVINCPFSIYLFSAMIDDNLINGFKNIEILELSGRMLHLSHEFFEAVGKNCHNLRLVHLQEFFAQRSQQKPKIELNISQLPDDCLIPIFSLLPIVDRIRIQRVCKRWRSLSLLSWNSLKILTFNAKNWGKFPGNEKRFPFRLEVAITQEVLRNVLKLCGKYVTCIDFSDYDSYPENESEDESEDESKYVAVIDCKSLFEEFKRLCPNLTSFRLSQISSKSQVIKNLAITQSNLREISMQLRWGCSIFISGETCDKEISLLFKNNQNLRCLNLWLPEILEKCWLDLNPLAVEEINFECSLSIPGNRFCVALERFVNLKIFTISTYSSIDLKYRGYINKYLKAISSHGETFEKLNIQLSKDFSKRPEFALHSKHFEHFRNLRELVLASIRVEANFFETCVKYCTKLTKVHLRSLNVTDLEVQTVLRLPELKELYLIHILAVTDAIFLNSLPSLTILHCRGCPEIKNAGLCELLHESAKNLETLQIFKCQNVKIEKLIEDGKEATYKRTNGPLLSMFYSIKNARDMNSQKLLGRIIKKTMISPHFKLIEVAFNYSYSTHYQKVYL